MERALASLSLPEADLALIVPMIKGTRDPEPQGGRSERLAEFTRGDGMSEENRYAAPKVEVGGSVEVSAEQLRLAHRALNWSRTGFVVFFASLVAMGYVRPQWAWLLVLFMLAALVLAHVFLGLSAARSGRSWVWYAVLPVVMPVLGGLVSFGILRSKVPYADA
jgi:uncharacterized membrane protein YphA (DoxX/SURF4 family)